MNVEVEGNELALTNEEGDVVIIPKHKRQEVLNYLESGDYDKIDDIINDLPVADDYAEDGTLLPNDGDPPVGGVGASIGNINKPKKELNKNEVLIRGIKLLPSLFDTEDIPNYTNKYKTEEEAIKFGRQEGYPDIKWKGKTLSTLHSGSLQQQLDETGITNEQMFRKTKFQRNLGSNIFPYDYNDPIDRVLSAAEGNKAKERIELENKLKEYEKYKTIEEIPGYENPETQKYYDDLRRDRIRMDVANFYDGIPQKYNSIKVSNFRPGKEKNKSSIYYALNDPEYEKTLISNLGSIKDKRIQAIKDLSEAKFPNMETARKYQKNASKYLSLDLAANLKKISEEDRKFMTNFESETDKLFGSKENIKERLKGISEYNIKTTGIAPTAPGAAMQNHQVTFGNDELGHYVAYYDKWDIAPFGDEFTKQKGIKQDFGKPIEFYNRLYYKVAGKNEDGSIKYETIPESEILAKKKKN